MSATATQAPKTRRPSARGLIKRLLSQSDQELAYWHVHLVPIGARAVLEAVADLIARSESGLEYQPDPALGGTLASWIAIRMRAVGAEDEIGGHLETLQRVNLIQVVDDAVRLPLQDPPVTAAAESAAAGPERLKKHIGRRPAGMPEEEWNRKVTLHRQAYARQQRDERVAAGQPELGLGLAILNGGRRPAGNSAGEFGNGNSAGNSIGISEGNSSLNSAGNSVAEFPGGNSSRATTATAEDDISKGNTNPGNSESAVAAVARASVPDAGIPQANSVGRRNSISDIIRAAPHTEADTEAQALARALCSGLQLPPEQARIAPGVMQLCLRQGFGIDVLREAVEATCRKDQENRATGARRITAVKYVLEKLWDARRPDRTGSAPQARERIPAAPDPRIEAEPLWQRADETIRGQITLILNEIERDAPRISSLKHWRAHWGAAFHLVAERRPELIELVEGSAAPRRQAAG